MNEQLLMAFFEPIIEQKVAERLKNIEQLLLEKLKALVQPEEPKSTKQIAKILGYSVSYVYKMVHDKKIPYHKLANKKLLFYISEINQSIKKENI